MNVRSCRKCKRLFNYVMGPNVCPACRDALEQDFQKVKKYVQENKNSDIRTVAKECEVDSNQIREWVREERLQFSEDSMVTLNCERCGVSIRSGRYCDACKRDMTSSFNSVINSAKPAHQDKPSSSGKSDGNKMRFI